MKTSGKVIGSLILLVSLFSTATRSQTPASMSSSYYEDFADIANWSDNFAGGVGASCYGAVAVNANGTIPDGMKISTSTASFASTAVTGGVQRGSLSGNPSGSIVLLAPGATENSTAVAIDLYLDFSVSGGYLAGTLSYSWASVNNGTGNRNASMKVYTSTDGTTFTELSGAGVLNITNNAPTNGTVSNVQLPASFSNCAGARLRFYCWNGTGGTSGSRPKISIDNVSVTNNGPLPVELASLTAVACGREIALRWSTATEVNNYGFDVERTPVGQQSWSRIAFVSGNGTSNIVHSYFYADLAASGECSYRLKQIDRDGTFRYSKAVEAAVGLTPTSISFGQNYPNPFNPSTTIVYGIPSASRVTVKIYSLLGREIATLVNDVQGPGYYHVVWNGDETNGTQVGSGVYFIRIIAEPADGKSQPFTQTRKMTLMK